MSKITLILKKFKEQLLLNAHPVGSIYMSSENISPNILFGGAWEQITISVETTPEITIHSWIRVA